MPSTPTRHIRLQQNAGNRLPFRWENAEGVAVDLTGWTARMQIRGEAPRPGREALPPLIDIGSGETGNDGDGTVTLSATGDVVFLVTRVAAQRLPPRGGFYDVLLYPPAGASWTEPYRLIQGRAIADLGVTRG